MRAAVIHGPGDVRIEEVPPPQPTAEQLLVEVCACGFDLPADQGYLSEHYAGDYPVISQGSLFGHEGSGTVLEGAGELQAGEHVGYLGPGYAEQALVNPALAVRVPGSLQVAEAAMAEPLAVVVNTLDHTAIAADEDIVVLGAGFMGLLLVQGLRSQRAGRIIVIEPRPERRERALELGATAGFDPLDGQTVSAIAELTGGGVGKCIEASGNPAALPQASALLRAEGTLIIHGYYHAGAEVDLPTWHAKELTVINSHPSSQAKYKRLMARALEMLANGAFDLHPLMTHRVPLEQVGCVPQMATQKDFIKAIVVL